MITTRTARISPSTIASGVPSCGVNGCRRHHPSVPPNCARYTTLATRDPRQPEGRSRSASTSRICGDDGLQRPWHQQRERSNRRLRSRPRWEEQVNGSRCDRLGVAEKPALPARLVLAACQTIGVGRSTHEWTSVAPAALFAGSEFVLATCRDLISDETDLDATVELCRTVYSSKYSVAAVNSLQRSHLADSGSAPSHPSLFYSAIIGRGEYDPGQG